MTKSETAYLKEIAALKEKLIFKQAILENVPGYIFVNEIEISGREISIKNVYANEQALKIVDYSRGEIDKMGNDFFRKVVHKEDIGRFMKSVEELKWEDDNFSYSGIIRIKPREKEFISITGLIRVIKREGKGMPLTFIICGPPANDDLKTGTPVAELLKENKKLRGIANLEKISKTERLVLVMLARGLSVKMIAEKLNRSEDTVKSHKKRMFKKLGLHNTAALVNLAHEIGLA